MASAAVPLAVRSSIGISITQGPPIFENVEKFPPVIGKSCRSMLFDPSGSYFAYADNHHIKLVKSENWEEVANIESKAYVLSFSPKGSFLSTWEPFTVSNANPQGSPNMKIYKTENGELIKTFVQKQQISWEPQWSSDEVLFSRMVNNDVVFYENANFEKIVARINFCKIVSYSLSPLAGAYYVLCLAPGSKGQPSTSKLLKYPNFEEQQTIVSKSFFQADKVEYYWNSKGNYALLLTMTEVDKTGKSYYGKQGLHIFDTTGKTSLVSLPKEGPIYNVAWSPKNQEFCVIYGFMPAKSTIFNLKCEPTFELGTGPRNSIYYSPFGNILLIGGFGNLNGVFETWDINNKKLITKGDASDTTLLEWCPDGVHFMTATTAPRLRIGNGYKLWHYSGTLLFERPWSQQDELYDVKWQKLPKSCFKEPVVTHQKVAGIESSQPKASTQAYRPPSARNRPNAVSFKLRDDEEEAFVPGSAPPSKAALKQRKKREARKAKKTDEDDGEGAVIEKKESVVSSIQVTLSGDPEKDKKIRNLKKKIDAILSLKEQQAQGKPLEVNQLAKIKTEGDLRKELSELQL